ncbi:MAG: hypothetical protein JSS30_04145 [Verrucomicrobia bacterium]|nr:hypothetical protein [Verrucomicrobiota bacterium]
MATNPITAGIRLVGRSLPSLPMLARNAKGEELMVTYMGQEPMGERDPRPRLLVKQVLDFEIPQDQSVVVHHANPFEAKVDGKATEIFSTRNFLGILTSRGQHRGFHGTSLMTLMRYGIGQLAERVFTPIGQRIYFDSVGTAIEYALEDNFYDEKTHWLGGQRWVRQGMQVKLQDDREATVLNLPVVLAISSDEAPKENDPVKDPGLFKYHYFSGNEPVHIDGAWLLDHNLSNQQLQERGGIKDDIGVGTSRRVAAAALRQVSGVVKYY